jgi:carbon monoxide dehydrogenase subunit G
MQGEHVIRAPRDRVWRLLNDPEVLARITPGVTTLAADGVDRYKATIAVAVGPLKSTFQGQIHITDKQPAEAMTLKVQARGTGGGVTATGRITLEDAPQEGGADATRVTWAGEPQLVGVLATIGGRLVQGAAKTQADQFFAALAREATSTSD